uniref:Uncharacterized protein n=1 Tax=Amphora coffeiformis TaxID=265554 RepID=A0A6S8I6F1_9STRA
MRSLSLPYSIEEYAKEIRILEGRMLSENENHLARGNHHHQMRRSMSTIDKNASDEEILLKHCAFKADEGFFVGEDSSSNDADRTQTDTRQPSGSFLPSFASNEASMEDTDHFVSFESSADMMNSSTRDLPIVEEGVNVEEQLQSHYLLDKEKQNALATVKALARLFELPSPGNDHKSSPVSVRDLWGGHTRRNDSETNHRNTNEESGTRNDHNPSGGGGGASSFPTRRSIFGNSSKCGEEAVPSWSGFGIFSMEGRAELSPLKKSEKPSSPHQFRILHKDDRANSLPSSLPRKSSLKRIPSLQSSSTDGGAANAPLKSVKRTVSFGKLETREFSIALSDHPSCSYGPPISLGWDFRDKETVELDHYEEQRSPRRQMHQMILSYNVRRFLLLKRAGYSHDELEAAMNEVERVKRERLVTDLLLPASKIDETVEEVVRRVKSMFGGPPAE